MRQKNILSQRIMTLTGLTAGPNGPFGAAGGDVAQRLVDGWAAERRLLQRLLDETKGDDVLATVAMWHDRTTAFLAKAGEGEGSWRDRDGHVWVGSDVLRVLEDVRQRIDTWQSEAAPPAAPAAGGGTVAVREAELAALREALGDDDADLSEALEDDDPDETALP